MHRGLQSSLQWDRGLQSSLQWERERERGRERGRERELVRRCPGHASRPPPRRACAVLAKLLEVALPDGVGRWLVDARVDADLGERAQHMRVQVRVSEVARA